MPRKDDTRQSKSWSAISTDPWSVKLPEDSEWDRDCEWDFGFDCNCSRCQVTVPVGMRCKCPVDILIRNDGTKYHSTINGHSDACRIHIKPGCPNPLCGETWIEAFRWPKCDACGWEAPSIIELP